MKKNENHSHNNSSETISGSLNSYENSKIAGIEKAIDYNFKNKKLLIEALSHSSYANENKRDRKSNERLEFLGDSVLSIVVSQYLFEHFSHFPDVLIQYPSYVVGHGEQVTVFVDVVYVPSLQSSHFDAASELYVPTGQFEQLDATASE